MIKRQDISGIAARAQEDARRFFFYERPTLTEIMFQRAMSDFEKIPYPLRWYLYRSNFRKALIALKKEYKS